MVRPQYSVSTRALAKLFDCVSSACRSFERWQNGSFAQVLPESASPNGFDSSQLAKVAPNPLLASPPPLIPHTCPYPTAHAGNGGRFLAVPICDNAQRCGALLSCAPPCVRRQLPSPFRSVPFRSVPFLSFPFLRSAADG